MNNLPAVKLLIKHNANINITDSIGLTPIYYAVINNNFEIISYLIESKSLINMKSHESFNQNSGHGFIYYNPGIGIIQLAISFIDSNDVKIIKYLIEQGAYINETDDYGWSPLHTAVLSGRLDIVKLLLDKGANIKAKTGRIEIDEIREMFPEGLTPIEIAKMGLKVSDKFQPIVDFLNAYK
jgi:serine/threonine-protein phosphatase 6 regulatory ankyrin repeat subunit B